MNVNPPNRPDHLDDDRRFDLLVDNELDEQQRRELLSSLDDTPGGWRRCALAFLEAQSWRKELWSFFRETDSRGTATTTLSRPRRWRRHAVTWAAMAACFLVALGSVWLFQESHQGGPMVPSGAVARSDQGPSQLTPVTVPTSAGPSSPWQLVTLSRPSATPGASAPVRLPAVQQNKLDSQWLSGLPKAVPDDVLQSLQRTGHQVRQRRELLPVNLDDGRRMVVPVDQVDVHYVGNPTL